MWGQTLQSKEKLNNFISSCIIAVCCIACMLFEIIQIKYVKDSLYNRLISDTLPLLFGSAAIILLLKRNGAKIFSSVENLLYLIPCLIIAVDNFPWYSYFQGNMRITRGGLMDYLLFSCYCLLTGIFEECIFRGMIFSIIASYFSNDKKGFLKTYVLSSVIFGAAHLLNVFVGANVGATLLQVAYSTLTGGLFAFAFIKTKNVMFAALTHAIYNFCGLLFSSTQGLGNGVIFDFPTGLIMAIISIIVGSFVLYGVWTYSEEERKSLYKKLNIHQKD